MVFEPEGPVGVASATVYTRAHPDGDRTPGRTRYRDPLGAVVTVTSVNGEGGCLIRIDGLVVAREKVRGTTATCVWLAD